MVGEAFVLGQWYTQYGRIGDFHNKPRWEQENALSLVRGRVTRREAAKLVGRRPSRGDAVRYTTYESLEAAGFIVRPDPQPLNPDHVLVEYPGEWDEDVCERFDSCFDEPTEER
jgi:hypothetical protein